jgi:alpha-N-acetylglucosamine transferase
MLTAADICRYDKIVYLDADILLLANIDELFDKLPLPLPGSREEAEELEVMERRPFAAASEVFPPDTFNSGN